MKNMILMTVILSACTADAPISTPAAKATTMLYTCHTAATCNGDSQYAEHSLCAQASDSDVDSLGDRAAEDWVSAWKVTCTADQGIVDDRIDGPTCTVAGTSNLGTFGCDAWCEPTYQACE